MSLPGAARFGLSGRVLWLRMVDHRTILATVFHWTAITRSSARARTRSTPTLSKVPLTFSFDRVTDQVTFSWNTQPGKLYSIEGSTDLTGFPIEVLPPFDPPSDTATFTVERAGESKLFYRVRELDAHP